MSARLVEPGTVLADRYVIEDMLQGEGPAGSWRAHDQILARSVVLQVLPSSSPYADRLLAAAKRAARVADPRILQVLDAVDDGELSYVVREWATGQSLEVILGEGPLPAHRAAWLVREIAGAMTRAHALGVTHGRLAPDTVVVADSNGVKIIGLGTLAALRDDLVDDPSVEDAEREDTAALGRLLYACLTTRWPGGGCPSLPTAPVEHGQLLRPRQVRAGVPRALDEICDRILCRPPRYGPPITSAAEVKDHLTHLLAHDSSPATGEIAPVASPVHRSRSPAMTPRPALLPRGDGGQAPDEIPELGARQSGSAPAPSERRRALFGSNLLLAAVAILVLGVTLLTYLVVSQASSQEQADPPPSTTSPSVGELSRSAPTTAVPLMPVQVASASSFDPYPGSGDEHPEQVPLAYDGDRSTVWETFTYRGNPALGGLKDGVGLLFDLGRRKAVRSVTVELQGAPTTVELRAAPVEATVAPQQSAQDYRLLGTVVATGNSAEFRLPQPVQTRYLLVWLTSLPPEAEGLYRGRVAEVKVYR